MEITLSVDTMGGDYGLETTIGGINLFQQSGLKARFILHGDEARIQSKLSEFPGLNSIVTIVHSDLEISEGLKASLALRQGRGSSMWNAIESVRDGQADAIISAGNTGALMAISIARLKRLKGVHRPALTALWPTPNGRTVVLDVGANLSADVQMLCDFAKLGHIYAKAMQDVDHPRIGLLNVGSEDQKGSEDIRSVAQILRDVPELNFCGYIEGDKISEGQCDVVVTNGFTGNAALKSGEGVARLVAGFVKSALAQSALTKAGAVLASGGLKSLKEKMDPANVNAGVMLGLRGLVVKSHGGAKDKGFLTTLKVAHRVAEKNVVAELSALMDPSNNISE